MGKNILQRGQILTRNSYSANSYIRSSCDQSPTVHSSNCSKLIRCQFVQLQSYYGANFYGARGLKIPGGERFLVGVLGP
jgi:hypothetical protein